MTKQDYYVALCNALTDLLDDEHGARDGDWHLAYEAIMVKVDKELDALQALREMREL